MSHLQRMRSTFEDNANMTNTDEDNESYSDNESGRKSGLDSKSNKQSVNKNTEDYKRRRERNNEAVRKSRERAKKNYAITEARVIKLREENRELELKKDGKTKELNVLQELAKSLDIEKDIK